MPAVRRSDAMTAHVHRWRIESPHGEPVAAARCACGEERLYATGWGHGWYGESSRKAIRAAQAKRMMNKMMVSGKR